MKFFNWVFGFRSKYDKHLYSYQKGGLAGKIVLLVLLIGSSVLGIFCELWAFKLFSETFIGGLIASIFAVAIIYTTVQETAIHATVGFKSAVQGKVVEKIDSLISHAENPSVIAEPITEKPKTNKKFDIFFGITCALLTAGTVITAVVLIFRTLALL